MIFNSQPTYLWNYCCLCTLLGETNSLWNITSCFPLCCSTGSQSSCLYCSRFNPLSGHSCTAQTAASVHILLFLLFRQHNPTSWNGMVIFQIFFFVSCCQFCYLSSYEFSKQRSHNVARSLGMTTENIQMSFYPETSPINLWCKFYQWRMLLHLSLKAIWPHYLLLSRPNYFFSKRCLYDI